jgi:hypothetical protein
MRFNLPLTVIATASMDSAAQDLVLEHRRRNIGSNGVRRIEERDELPHLVKAIVEKEGEGGVRLKDEVGVAVVNDNNEEQIVADLIDQNNKKLESSQSSHSTIVKWDEKGKETTTGTKETKRKKESSKETRTKKKRDNTMDIDHAGEHENKIDEQLSSLELCPPRYSISVVYKAGDTIESQSNVWECQAAPYEKYCSIELDEGWPDDEIELWHDSWIHVGTCEKLVATNHPTKVRQVLERIILCLCYSKCSICETSLGSNTKSNEGSHTISYIIRCKCKNVKHHTTMSTSLQRVSHLCVWGYD